MTGLPEPQWWQVDGDTLLDRLNAQRGELGERLGLQFVEAGPDRVVATLPVPGNRQPFGLLHGGASAALAETLGSVHAALVGPAGAVPVGIELNCTHHRSATDGTVTGTCTAVHTGRTLATFQITVRGEQDRAVCTARLTCLYRTT